jgi:hypothetical protein
MNTNLQLLDDFEVVPCAHNTLRRPCACVHSVPDRVQPWPLTADSSCPSGWQATVYVDSPTVPCVHRGTFTIHQYFEPPITFAIGSSIPVLPPGELRSDGEVPPAPALASRLECLLCRRIVVPVPGPFAIVNKTVRLWEHLHEVNRAVLGELELDGMDHESSGESDSD